MSYHSFKPLFLFIQISARSSLKKFENEKWPKAGYLPRLIRALTEAVCENIFSPTQNRVLRLSFIYKIEIENIFTSIIEKLRKNWIFNSTVHLNPLRPAPIMRWLKISKKYRDNVWSLSDSLLRFFFCFIFSDFSTSIKCTIDYNPLNLGWNRPLWYDPHIYSAKLWVFHIRKIKKSYSRKIWHLAQGRVLFLEALLICNNINTNLNKNFYT